MSLFHGLMKKTESWPRKFKKKNGKYFMTVQD